MPLHRSKVKMKDKMISVELIEPKVTELTITRIANDLNNHANYILINSQVILDIWEDATRLLQVFQKNNPDKTLLLHGLSLKEVKDVVPKMLEANIIGSGRVSEIANLIKTTNSYREYSGVHQPS